MQEIEQPLVSIVVITYNSSKYVIETLESAKAQTYENIELIVSDDCSTDNTVEICKGWIENNKDRFVRTDLITVEKNSGIAPNCNRGLFNAQGEWVKLIAGDDVLLNNCIALNHNYSLQNPKADFIFSKSQIMQDSTISEVTNYSYFHNENLNLQTKLILLWCQFHAITAFIRSNTLKQLGGYDEKYPFMEDHPLWVKAIINKKIFFGFEEVTCYYRIHNNNISLRGDKLFNINFNNSLITYIKDYLIKENIQRLYILNTFFLLYYLLISKIIILNKNRPSYINNILSRSIDELRSLFARVHIHTNRLICYVFQLFRFS